MSDRAALMTLDPPSPKVRYNVSLLSDMDLYLFNEGNHFRLFEKLGAHPHVADGEAGTYFAVWAPNAEHVFVMGDFNNWEKGHLHLGSRGHSGIWEGFLPGVRPGASYKYHIVSHHNGYKTDRADPFAFTGETPPHTASRVWPLDYAWHDEEWMEQRRKRNAQTAPISVYEMHLGSWRRVVEDGNRWMTYRELAAPLADYLNKMGFTHVEFLPVMEHPFYGSWGYQVTSFFAPTSRYGTPQDLMYLINYLHQHNIGVILDWVPSHFPSDEHGLAYFDGTHLYEHADARKGFHQDWKTYIFNYGRNEVKSFLISSARFWLDKYHVDGLRVDAVASMLYLDYSRQDGDWIPNEFGGRENLEAITFLRQLNQEVYRAHPDVQMIAEESTAWPMVSRPTYVGGLGFGLKWDMGWMHDTLKYMALDPVFRKYHHNQLTFRMLYAFTENFMLSLSHDEVVYGKGSLLNKMPGDLWQRFANLRLLFGSMFAQPGKKLLFMGGEFGAWNEWDHEKSLDWHLLDYPQHAGVRQWVGDLNWLYANDPTLHEWDLNPEGFHWIDANDSDQSTLSFLRAGREGVYLIACNFTPVPRYDYRVGVPHAGFWKEVINSDAREYGGSGLGNLGGVMADGWGSHGQPASIKVVLPPLGIVFFKYAGGG
jgi:1,4-alpha-glucan branching enzyme